MQTTTNTPTPTTILRIEKMKLGRRVSYLQRCIKCAKLLNEFETDYSIRSRIFEIHIKPVFNCSYATFNNMLNEPNPQKQLVQIEQKIRELEKPPKIEVLPIEQPKDNDDWI